MPISGSGAPHSVAANGPAMSPATKASRQPASLEPAPNRPPTMPATPAMRPSVSIKSTAESPISTPPASAGTTAFMASRLRQKVTLSPLPRKA